MGLVMIVVCLLFAPLLAAQSSTASTQTPGGPLSAITGRVFDPSEQPVAGNHVEAVRRTYKRGRRLLTFAGQSQSTDSQGNFRVWGLAAGKYYLQVFRPNLYKNIGLPGEFYPGTDLTGAVAIDVPSHTDVPNMDIHLKSTDAFTIRGHLTGALESGQVLTVAQKGGTRGVGVYTNLDSNGAFALVGAAAGTYLIQPLPASGGSAGASHQWLAVGRAEVVVTDHDVNNVVLSATYGLDINGSVRMENGTPPQRPPTVRLLETEAALLPNDPAQRAKSDGTFSLAGVGAFPVRVSPLRYRVEVADLDESSYVSTIRFGSRDATHSVLDLTGQTDGADTLDVTLASDAGIVTGRLPDMKVSAAVAIWSANGDVRVTKAIPGQPFRIGSLAPGPYRILAWEGIETDAAEYPPFLARFTAAATPVIVQSGVQEIPELKVIPQASAQAELERLP